MTKNQGDMRTRDGGAIDEIVRRLDPFVSPAGAPAQQPETAGVPRARELRAASSAIAALRLKEQVFGPVAGSDAAWHILLHLFLAEGEGKDVSIRDACGAGESSEAVHLRSIAALTDAGLVTHRRGNSDAKDQIMRLTAKAKAMMSDYFARLEGPDGAAA